jgi:hypothetical protein
MGENVAEMSVIDGKGKEREVQMPMPMSVEI